MSRSDRGLKKFSFPLPRRSRSRLQKPLDNAEDDTDARSIPPSISGSIRPSRHHEEPISKAHEILGTSSSLHTSTPTPTPSLPPPSPGFVSVVISETTAGSHIDDWDSLSTPDDTRRPPMSKQPSSNVLGRIYSGDRKWGSDYSGSSSRLHPQTSNSTLRSHYDAKKSPLSISQQTSDSAIRDRALRRGRTPVLTDKGYDGYVANPVSPVILDEAMKKHHKKSKPARLDLSRLFPRPKDSWDQRHGNAVLSPAKMVNSPAALSVNSEYFHHSPSRDWTPQATPNKLQKNRTPTRRQPSPVRIVERDEYDNAKVHVRRPPKGVQHWFDALDEDSDESSEETRQKSAPRAVRSHGASAHNAPVAAHPSQSTRNSTYGSRSQNNMPATYKRDSFALEDIVDVRHLTSPSQYSVNTYHSQTSSRTKESVLAKTNLQDSSVLSFSSSEDEGDSSQFEPTRTFNRQSVDSSDYTGDIVIGRAQTFEMRSPHSRQHSTGKMSTFSTSTNAATIDIMYTPEPPLPTHRYSRNRTYSGGKRASHMRQPSVILEDEDSRPKIAFDEPASPSNRSVMSSRTSASAPQLQTDASQRFMQVTAEEEALLELMRKKRAAMNKLCASQAPSSEPTKEQKVASETFNHGHGKSGPSESSPLRVDTRSRNRTSSSVSAPHQPSTRGRSAKVNSVVSASQLRDSSTSDAWSDRNHSPASRGRSPHFMASTEFSGLHTSSPRSPTPAAGAASPTTTDHPSPLPSPLTPARYVSDRDVDVKVADSDISNDLDDMPILDQIVIGAPPESVKSDSSRELSAHRRRRTASSDAEIKFPVPPTSHSFRDLASVSEGSSRPPSIVEPPAPKPQKKALRHISEVALGSIETRNRQSSPHSAKSHTSSPNSTYINSAGKTRSRHLSPDCITSTPRIANEDRDSVSEDVLAAWNSLGGTY